LHALSVVPDPRSRRGLRYPLAGLLLVAVCAVLAGASSFTAVSDWLHDLDDIARAGLGFVRGVPATSTMWRLLTRLDPGCLVPQRPYTTTITICLRMVNNPSRRRTADFFTMRGGFVFGHSRGLVLGGEATRVGPSVGSSGRDLPCSGGCLLLLRYASPITPHKPIWIVGVFHNSLVERGSPCALSCCAGCGASEKCAPFTLVAGEAGGAFVLDSCFGGAVEFGE
jgi:hypothetical protein